MENSHHDEEAGLRSNWLMAGSWGQLVVMHAKKGRTSTSTMRPHDGQGDTSRRVAFEESLVDGWSTASVWAP